MQLLQCSIFHNLLRNFAALQVLLDILLLTWGASEDYEIVVKTLNSGYSIWINFFFVLFRSGHFYNIVSTFTNVVKLDVENDNVVLTLSNVVHVNVEIHNVDSTLLDVVNFNVEIYNIVSTLIWRCPTSRRRIKLKTNVETTLKCLLGGIGSIILELGKRVTQFQSKRFSHNLKQNLNYFC